MASSPVVASAITIMPASMLMEPLMPMRTTKWSSTTNTRVFDCFFILCRSDEIGLFVKRESHLNARAISRFAADAQLRANLFCALLHPEQAEVPAPVLVRRLEAAAIVFDVQSNAFRFEAKRHHNARCAGMFDGVVDGFLRDAKQMCFGDARKTDGFTFNLCLHGDACAFAKQMAGFANRRGEIAGLQSGTTQIPNRAMHFSQTSAHHLPRDFE